MKESKSRSNLRVNQAEFGLLLSIYTVNSPSQRMIPKNIFWFAKKMVPTLAISVCLAQSKAEGSQPTLPKQMLNARNIKE